MRVLHEAATARNSPGASHVSNQLMFKGKGDRPTCRLAMPSTYGLSVPCLTREGTRLRSFHTGWADIMFVCAIGKQQPIRNACDSTPGRTFLAVFPAHLPVLSVWLVSWESTGAWDMLAPLSSIPFVGQSGLDAMTDFPSALACCR